jgi:hypothetical protein
MSTMSEEARNKAKSKAERLVRADPRARVDASGYTPDGAMDADVVTGPRPISRRQYRQGGKVAGDSAPHRADRKPRASGGNVNAYVNRDIKDANKERGGLTHDGGMKSGGRTGKFYGGAMGGRPGHVPVRPPMGAPRPVMRNAGGRAEDHKSGCGCAKCSGGRVGRARGGPAINDGTRPVAGRLARKGGGRTKGKTNVNIIIAPQGGGQPAMPPQGAGPMPPGGPVGLHQAAPPPAPMGPPAGAPPPMMARKSGGKVGEGFGAKLIKPGAYPIETGAGGGLGRLEKAKAARP